MAPTNVRVFDGVVVVVALVFVLIAILFTVRAQHRGRNYGSPPKAGPERASTLERKLDEWQREGLVEPQVAAAILEYEQERARPVSRIPMAAEAVGYVGTALVVAAISMIVADQWDDLAVVGRLAVLLVPSVLAGLAGWYAGRAGDPAFERMGSVLWVLAIAGWVGTLVVVFADVIHGGDPPEHGGPLFVASFATIVAVALYWVRRLPLQLLVVYVTTLFVVVGVVNALEAGRDEGLSSVVWGLAVVAFGAIWTAVGGVRAVTPSEVGRALGPASALIGAQIVRGEAASAGIWLGLVAAGVVLAIGVIRSDVLVLLVGTVGLFQWAPQLAIHYLADSLGTEVTLLIVGVLLLGVAVAFWRLYRRLPGRAQ